MSHVEPEVSHPDVYGAGRAASDRDALASESWFKGMPEVRNADGVLVSRAETPTPGHGAQPVRTTSVDRMTESVALALIDEKRDAAIAAGEQPRKSRRREGRRVLHTHRCTFPW